jgi:nucleoid-associated protein YgaU
MLPPNSRYAQTESAKHERADGKEIVHLRRRLLPDPAALAQISVHTVRAGERPDSVAAEEYGDPELWWRVADANGVRDPAELTDTPGRRLRITLPQGIPGAPDA